jgi:hypothetical protein
MKYIGDDSKMSHLIGRVWRGENIVRHKDNALDIVFHIQRVNATDI